MIDRQQKFIIATIVLLSLFAFYIRIIPLLNLSGSPVSLMSPDDPYYNFRLVEQVVTHGTYPWFDPMTFYPNGSWLNWGPLFTYICAGMAILFGATGSIDGISGASLIVPPLLAALCIPLVYSIGKIIGDWKTGIISAIFLTFMSGQFFQRSVAGYLDHHIAEVFFSLLFIVLYIYSIKHLNEKNYIWLSLGTGISFFLGVLVMPTMILFAMITWIFSFIWLYYTRNKLFAFFNIGTFGIVAILFALFIPWTFGMGLDIYSFIHIIAYIIVAATSFIFVWKKGDNWWIFAAIGIFLILLIPDARNLLWGSITQFFGQTPYTATVQEARAWDFGSALAIYNVALPVAIIGMFAMIYKIIMNKRGELLFIAIWCITVLYATIQHVRYEYYLAAVVSIAAAYALSLGIDASLTPLPEPKKKKGKKPVESKRGETVLRYGFIIFSILTIGIFIYTTLPPSLYLSENIRNGVSNDWIEPLTWMKTNTPDPGMNYNQLYTTVPFEYPKPAYNYPSQSYGVISWWDYGHIILYYAHRMPTANPFQQGVQGNNGAANFFITNNETEAARICNDLAIRYVVTDIEMATAKFWAMATWANVNPDEYMSMRNGQTVVYKPYVETMIARLHMLDGTSDAGAGVMALQHFRLVRESPSVIEETGKFRYVKIFEYVKGAEIHGTSPVQINIITNSGRNFTYTQTSTTGAFVVPYAGIYTDANGKEINVNENDVINGVVVT